MSIERTAELRASLQHTKILCTLGPATASREKIRELLLAGADAVRLNFSHAKHETHEELFRLTREVAAELGRHVPIIQDLQGPKIRVGALSMGPVALSPGETVVLTVNPVEPGDSRIPVGYRGLASDVVEGDPILLDDGLIRLEVEGKRNGDVTCRVINGGLLKERKGINLPGVAVSEPSLTAKDREDLELGVRLGVDYVALSFVRSAQDLIDLRRVLAELGAATPIIAKIEKIEAIRELDAIIAVADALMVARGDLGVELPGHEVPLLQKRIIKRCNECGTPVITATQMLESMIQNPRPTRAESSDVANAVFDGTDVVMLSGETSVGAFPIDVVTTMNDILRSTEAAAQYTQAPVPTDFETQLQRTEFATAVTACDLARYVRATAILCITYTGNTAKVMSRYRPGVPIIAMVAGPDALSRELVLYRSVYPVSIEQPENTEQALSIMKAAALRAGVVDEGDLVVITTGFPLDEKASTNMLVVDRV